MVRYSEEEPKERKKTKNSVIVFPCERIEDILIPPDLHKSSVICYRLNKIIFTERRSKSKKKKMKWARNDSNKLNVRYDRARDDVRIPKSLCECADHKKEIINLCLKLVIAPRRYLL